MKFQFSYASSSNEEKREEFFRSMNRIKCLSKTHWLRWCSKSWKMFLSFFFWDAMEDSLKFLLCTRREKNKHLHFYGRNLVSSALLILFTISRHDSHIEKTSSNPISLERQIAFSGWESNRALSIPNMTSSIIPFLLFNFRMTYKREKIFGITEKVQLQHISNSRMCKFLKLLTFRASRFTSSYNRGWNNYGNKLHTQKLLSAKIVLLSIILHEFREILFVEFRCGMGVWEHERNLILKANIRAASWSSSRT
jgi:hypothetical protein